MFMPTVFHRNTGRPALNKMQDKPHTFFIRAGTERKDETLLVVHDMGAIERPLNSTAHLQQKDVFAVLSKDNLEGKKTDSENYSVMTHFKSPQNISKLEFSFISANSGLPVQLGNQNATLVFDLFCANE